MAFYYVLEHKSVPGEWIHLNLVKRHNSFRTNENVLFIIVNATLGAQVKIFYLGVKSYIIRCYTLGGWIKAPVSIILGREVK